MTQIRELLDIPEVVRKGDFVLSLARGVDHPEETVRSYAITPGLLHAFGRALSLVDGALQGGRSQATFLHGSFGAGKSHFMAVLDLMLQGHPAPWNRPELHPLRARYAWLAEPKVLQLPLHMIGAETIEQKVFSSYVGWVKERHPDAPIPALYADQELFENARRQRGLLGDEKFFAVLNEGTAPRAGWGKRAAGWDSARFEEALASNDRELRERLFGQLVKTHFPAYAGQTHRFIELDHGLAVLARHAASLGYKAVVLYLDELILWLAGKVANLTFVQDEAQKLAKLKEAQDERRDIPIVSFIARQRDLAELVGDKAAGDVRTTLKDSLAWSAGRFETITLEDRNLPAVVAHRVVRPRDDRARALLEESFTRMRRSLGNAWGTLLGATGEEADFKRVYPFSPALIDALVAVSDCLQRERTALKVLMELLVEHLRTLEAGQVVAVGDIFDVLAAGEEAFDPLMQARFNRARELYRNHLLALIQDQHKTTTKETCQRLRPEHPAGLGCSDCPQRACRNDNRLAKTLLLAAFVPNAPPFKGFTVSRLVQLNPGAVVTPIPGTEASTAAEKLRNWALKVGSLRVGEQGDPEVNIRLEGVDTQPILEQAREADTPGARRQLLQEILFKALGLPIEGGQRVVPYEIEWRGTRRLGKVRFGNVRELTDEALTCPVDAAWYVVIDYPFDDAGYTPQDDESHLGKLRDALGARPNPTYAWLPCFFSDKVERELGQLVILEHILAGDNGRKYLGHLRPEDQTRARMDLESMRNQAHAFIRRSLEQVYGLTAQRDESLFDPARIVENPWVPLAPSMTARPFLAADFPHALEQLADRLLEHQFPHHPRFDGLVTPGKLEKVRELVDKLLESPEHRLNGVDRAEHKLLKEYAAPLGLVSLGETSAQLEATPLKAMDQQRAQAGVESPTVESARRYADPGNTMGLPVEAADLLVYTYAFWSGRSLERGGLPVEVERLGHIRGDVELVRPELPSEEAWHAAIEKAGALFGLAQPGRALHARNLTDFGVRLTEQVAKQDAARRLPAALRPRLEEWARAEAVPSRLATALSAVELLDGLSTRRALDQVRFLAAFTPRTSATALSRSLNDAQAVLRVLADEAQWLNFKSIRSLLGDETRRIQAQDLLDELAIGLAADQLNTALPELLRRLTQKASGLLDGPVVPPPPPPPPGWRTVASRRIEAQASGADIVAAVQSRIAEALQPLGLDGEVRVEVQLTVQRKGGGGPA